MYSSWLDATKHHPMRISFLYRFSVTGIVLVVAACAQQPTHTPPPAKNAPPVATQKPDATAVTTQKSKPKPKPATPTVPTKPDAPVTNAKSLLDT